MTTYNGHCHCGQTEWTVKIQDPAHVLCHCDACKLLSGGESTLNTIVPKDDLKITKGDLKTYTYQGDSGNPVHCYYCSNCTSSPYHHQTVLGDKYVVRTGLLEGSKDWKVALEIFGKDRLTWQPEVAQTMPGAPS
ncbi:MAG: hypothetical protein LQ338_001899 [Usnochroma carphineum]|nr:MAG: hypothetical protein LQ338_001899 [Usnochroma carphineum]